MNKKNLLSWAWIVLCGALTLATFLMNSAGSHPSGQMHGAYFDADVASEMVIASSLVKHGGFLVVPGFYYSTEVAAVGDHLTLALGLLLFPNDWTLARGVSLLINMVLVVASYRFMAKTLDTWDDYKWVAGLFLLPFGLIYMKFFLLGQFYMLTVCLCCLVVALCALARRRERVSPRLLAVGAVLGLVFGLNGIRTPILYYFPAVITAAFIALWESNGKTLLERVKNISRGGFCVLAESMSVLVGGGVGFLINHFILARICQFAHYAGVGLDAFKASEFLDFVCSGFIESWGFTGSEKAIAPDGIANLAAIVFTVIMLACIGLCVARWRTLGRNLQFAVCYTLVGYAWSACVYWLYGTVASRYLTFFAAFAIVLLPIALKEIRRDRLLASAVTGLTMLLLFVQATGFWYLPSVKHMLSGEAYPKEQVAQWLVDEGHTNGYATFWNCNDLVELSDGKLDVWGFLPHVHDDPNDDHWWSLKNYEWLEEASHAEGDPEGEVFLITSEIERGQLANAHIDLGEAAYQADEYCIHLFDSANAMRQVFGLPPK